MKIRNHGVILNEQEKFRLRLMDAYDRMEPKNVRYLCRLFGIHHATFYRIKSRYNRFNLNTIKLRSRKPKRIKTIPWEVVIKLCQWKRNNPVCFCTWRVDTDGYQVPRRQKKIPIHSHRCSI